MTTELRLPDDFDDGLWDAKGYFRGAELVHMGRIYALTFYDPVRLAQDIEADLENSGLFFEENLVVVRTVNRRSLEVAVNKLVGTGRVHQLLGCPQPELTLSPDRTPREKAGGMSNG